MFNARINDKTIKKNKKTNANLTYDASMVNLLATPEKFNGKKVCVIGVGNVEFEGDSIYLHKEDWQYTIWLNGLWLEFGGNIFTKDFTYKMAQDYNGRYVIVEGVFNMRETGHFGMWAGAIINVSRDTLYEYDFTTDLTGKEE